MNEERKKKPDFTELEIAMLQSLCCCLRETIPAKNKLQWSSTESLSKFPSNLYNKRQATKLLRTVK